VQGGVQEIDSKQAPNLDLGVMRFWGANVGHSGGHDLTRLVVKMQHKMLT